MMPFRFGQVPYGVGEGQGLDEIAESESSVQLGDSPVVQQLPIQHLRLQVTWWTHKIRNLHRNDFIMAAKTDQLYQQ